VTTDQGSAKIADVKVGMNVITFNEVLEKNELKKVTGVYKNAVDVQEKKQPQWYKITLENGEILTLTGNHRIWIKNLKCWRRVDELNGTEEILNIHQF
jgi:intein/homing endonuclease